MLKSADPAQRAPTGALGAGFTLFKKIIKNRCKVLKELTTLMDGGLITHS